MKKSIILVSLLFMSIRLFAQYVPPNGTEDILYLYSPAFLSGGTASVNTESPMADSLNPAVSGNKQRTILDFNYIALAGLGTEPGWGNIVNSGITLPSKYGVFSGNLHFLQSPFSSINMGVLGGIDVSFSKDIFPELSFGAGISLRAGAAETTDWGLGLNLGILGFAGDMGILKDITYGIAIKDMGKGYKPVAGRNAFPPIFTPSLSTAFNILKTALFSLRFSSDITLPSFQDFRFMLGTELGYRDFIFLRSAYQFDLMELIDTNLNSRIFPVSFGGTVKLKNALKNITTSSNLNRSEININFSAAPMQNGIWAFGLGLNVPLGVIDKNPPSIDIGLKDIEYISPNLDGIMDTLIVPVSIKDERYIKGYNFIVSDATGKAVRIIVNKDIRPENLTFKNFIDRLLYVKKGIEVPSKLIWDGKTDKGKVAADGKYTYYVEAWDDNGNRAKSTVKTVVVDDTAPSVKVESPYLVFSPNGDKSKDVLVLNQVGTKEDLWQAFFQDTEGNDIKKYTWQNSKPPNFEWDGKNDKDVLSKDGVYNYRITSTDRAGNTGSASLKNIIINTQATPINVSIDKSYFSPNGDKIMDTVLLSLIVPVTSGIEKWNLDIKDSKGNIKKVFSGKGTIPSTIVFDGKDDKNVLLPEGKYRAELNVHYINGNNPTAMSPYFYIDTTKPSASVKSDIMIFSPNGDGNKDNVTLFQETSEEINWKGTIKNGSGKVVKTFFWRGKADSKIVWDGRDDKGMLVPDGKYTYLLETSDRAGNYGKSNIVSMVVNTQETPVFLSTDLIYFSPNSDGEKDNLKIIPHIKVKIGIESYTLEIKDTKNNVVREFSGRNGIPKEFKWDGLDNKGKRVKDGRYYAYINLKYTNGNNPKAKTQAFTVDTQFPVITASASYKLFSPDGDGRLDTLKINQKSSNENLWEASIKDSSGKVVKSYFWKGSAVDFTWDGKDENGNKLPDGRYTYAVQSMDKAGNKASAQIGDITIDTRPTPVFVTVQSRGFSPNNDGYMDTISFKIYVSLKEGISSWNLKLINNSLKKTEKVFSGSSDIPDLISWDGKNDSGNISEGDYIGVLTLNYFKGNMPAAKTNSFILDISPPKVSLEISPKPFSPDNDGVDDELYLNIKVNDLSPIRNWEIKITDPKDNLFSVFSGKGVPSDRIVWNGVSDTGELVQAAEDYPLIFTIRDDFGNIRAIKKVIPVDVLVIREGNKLKIRISSITFAPNSPDFITLDETKAAKNEKTLKRLAEILKKYNRYSIRIEGHAVNLSWYDPVKAAKEEKEELLPLSLARAEAVKEALVKLGVNAGRISTAGLGGSQPIVPFSDKENRWKDRRVEFILIKK